VFPIAKTLAMQLYSADYRHASLVVTAVSTAATCAYTTMNEEPQCATFRVSVLVHEAAAWAWPA
jgi:hypothetical protein